MTKIAAACLVLLTASAASAAEPEVVCELGQDRVYLGESVRYQVTLGNIDAPATPDLAGFDDFNVVSAGQSNLSSSHISITINGRQTTSINRQGQTYLYLLTPRRAGRLVVPAPTVRLAGGRTIHGNELSLEVAEPDSQDVVLLELTADPPSVFPSQTFTVTLSVLVRPLPADLADRPDQSDRSPLSVQPSPPMLQIPWADDSRLPEGIEPTTDARTWLLRLHDVGGQGFGINNLREAGMFSLIERREVAFQPRPTRVVRKDAQGRDVEYWLYAFNRAFTAKRTGRFDFGPVSLKGQFATGFNDEGQLTGEHIYAVAKQLVVESREVPDAGRPPCYLGAVGQFTWSAELSPTDCKVGDPITLTLVLRGRGSLDSAVAPDLAKLTDVSKCFKTYEGTREIKGDTCRFTYTLRPLDDKITEFPPIAGAYFDPLGRRYVTLKTEPINMHVEKAAALVDSRLKKAPSQSTDNVKVRREGIYANVTDPGELANQTVHPERWLFGAAGLAAFYGLTALGVSFARRRSSDPASMRRRGASARARRRLREGIARLSTRESRLGADDIRGALIALVADAADASEAGMTSTDACRRLRGIGVDDPLVDRLALLLEACDAARYAPSGAGVDDLGGQAEELLDSLVQSLKKRRCL